MMAKPQPYDRFLTDVPTLLWSGQYILGGEDGHTPIPCFSLIEWGLWFQSADRCVEWTGNAQKYVSTVFLGLDHRFFGDGPPLVFETMVFQDNGRTMDWGRGPEPIADDLDQERYGTWAAAKAGHKRMVEKWLINAATRVNREEEAKMSTEQNFGDVLDRADAGDFNIIEWTVAQARKVIDDVEAGENEDIDKLTSGLDQAQGDASSAEAPRYLVIKISPDAPA